MGSRWFCAEGIREPEDGDKQDGDVDVINLTFPTSYSAGRTESSLGWAAGRETGWRAFLEFPRPL